MHLKSHNILISGVSSGIGQATAHALLQRGARVFGTVRHDRDGDLLRTTFGARFHPLVVDLKAPESIDRGVEQVAHELGTQPLHALVNNAGVALPGPLAEQPVAQMREMFEVNFFGLVSLTRRCLPLLGLQTPRRESPGKIINVSSGAGKVGIPFLAAYVASKHALEGFSHSLRRELLPWGVQVVIVGPGNVKTPIWSKAGDAGAYAGGLFGDVYRRFLEVMREGEKRGMEPEEIAGLIVKIVEAPSPKTRYQPVAQKLANWTLPRLLPDKALDRLFYATFGMKAAEEATLPRSAKLPLVAHRE